MSTPLVFIDIDGVMQPLDGQPRPEWKLIKVQLGRLSFHVMLREEYGEWLRELRDSTGAELAWGTRWGGFGDMIWGTLLGIPGLRCAPTLPPVHKADGFVPWAGGRPFVWFDDEDDIAGTCGQLASWPHKVIKVDPAEGLTKAQVDEARDWLLGLRASSGEPGAGDPRPAG